jgi:hypothetical protein
MRTQNAPPEPWVIVGTDPEAAIAWRIDQRAAAQPQAPEPLRMPPPLNQLPWSIAKGQFGIQGADFSYGSTNRPHNERPDPPVERRDSPGRAARLDRLFRYDSTRAHHYTPYPSLAPAIETSQTFQRPFRFAETEFKQLN